MKKIIIREDQLEKLMQEDSLVDHSNDIDGFIQGGNITALAHHYAKADEEGKQGLLSKVSASQGPVMAQRVKIKAQSVMEENGIKDESKDTKNPSGCLPNPYYRERNTDAVGTIGFVDDVPLEETTTTGSAGGQYSSKYFLDPKHGKNPEVMFKGGAVVKANPDTHDSGVGSFTIVKGQIKEAIENEVSEQFGHDSHLEMGVITYKNFEENVRVESHDDLKRLQWIIDNDPDFVKFEIFVGPIQNDFVINTDDKDPARQELARANYQKYKEMDKENLNPKTFKETNNMEQQPPVNPTDDHLVDEDLAQSLTNADNYNKVPRQILKLANTLNDLIKQCVDSEGEPVGVYDNNNTWQQEYIYSIDIVKNRLVINTHDHRGKIEDTEIFPPKNKRSWNDEWLVSDVVGSLKNMIRNYKRTINSLPKRQASIDAEFNDIDEEQINELSPETYKGAADKSYISGRTEKAHRIYDGAVFNKFVGLSTMFGKIDKLERSSQDDYTLTIDGGRTFFIFNPYFSRILGNEKSYNPHQKVPAKEMDRRTANILIKIAQLLDFKQIPTLQQFNINSEGGMNETEMDETELAGIDSMRNVSSASPSGDSMGGDSTFAPLSGSPDAMGGEDEPQFTTESLFGMYEDVCSSKGEDSDNASKLKNILIEFGNYDNPNEPINSIAIDEFKKVYNEEFGAMDIEETTGSASSGQFSGPLRGRATTPEDMMFEEGEVAEDRDPAYYSHADIDDAGTSITKDIDTKLRHVFGDKNVMIYEKPNWTYSAYVRINGTEYEVGAVGERFAARVKGYSKFNVFDTLEELIETIVSYEKGNHDDPIEKQDFEMNESLPLQEESLTISPAMLALKQVHAATAKITKAEMKDVKDQTIKATEAKGTQFVGKDNTTQTDEVALIRQGMEDLEYDGETGEAFDKRFDDNIDRDLSTDKVVDQFGHVTPADEMSNVVETEVGANILKAVKKKEALPVEPRYAKEAQPVKIVKEGIFKETDEFLITESEKSRIDEEASRMKALMGYKPEDAIKTKGNKIDNSLFKGK